MDNAIFRKETNDFVRFDDGQIFLTADDDELKREYDIEVKDNSKPVIMTLMYNTDFYEDDTSHTIVDILEDGNRIDKFEYDDIDFWPAFNEWANNYRLTNN